MKSEKTLFLLDGFALVYRAYFAFINNPRVNSAGMNTSAIFGFTNVLLDVIHKRKPSHLAVVFDPREEKSVRSENFLEYKAHRQEMPEDIKNSLPYIERLLEAFNVPLLVCEGYEADDVIGTLAQKAEKEGFTVFIMSPDKDLSQLVTEKILWYRPGRMGNPDEVLGVKEVCEKFDVDSPLQVIDLLGLMGDSADNIPGIPGVGEKTALKFLKEFGSVEGLLANTDKLSIKLKEKVEQGAELAILSKQLATVILDAPVKWDEEALRIDGLDKEKINALFAELEFRNLNKRVFGEELNAGIKAAPQPAPSLQGGLFDEVPEAQEVSTFETLENTNAKYVTVETREAATRLAERMMKEDFCFDTETTSTDTLRAELVGLAVSFTPGEAFYVPFPAERNEALQLIRLFAPALENRDRLKTGQNLKYDLGVLANYGIHVAPPLFDTMLAHYLLEPDMRHGMDFLAQTYLHYNPVSIETLIGKKGDGQGNMRDVPLEKIAPYACEDADITLQLKNLFYPGLDETETRPVFETVEIPLVPVLSAMEREGVKVDTEVLKKLSDRFTEEAKEAEKEIFDAAGIQFNIASPKQLGEILFDRLKLDPKAKKTRTGQYSTNEETLSKLAGKHPVIDHILNYRELQKLKSTYVDSLPRLIHPLTGRIHTEFNQAVASTGRLSSTNPNLQNIPVRTERGKEIRSAFVPRNEEYVLLSADYSQVELRIIASLSGEQNMIEAFRNQMDIHTATAARLYGIDPSEVTRDQRSAAKTVNFGIIYGISAFGLSQRVNISRTEAAEIIENYFNTYPNIKKYMNDSVEYARQHGFVKTITGRRRYLKDIHSANFTVRGFAERNAINAPIQGTAADIIKMAMIQVHAEMEKRRLRSRMILQVHDELVFDCHKEEVDEMTALVREKMETAVSLEVPLEAETGVGTNWLAAH
jgi:DNA polymerase-1